MRAPTNILPLAFAGACVLATAGCADNLARRDTFALSSGNSVAANRAIQTIDPWPRRSYLRGQEMDGEKAATAIQRYRTGDAPAAPAASIAITPGNGTANGSGAQ